MKNNISIVFEDNPLSPSCLKVVKDFTGRSYIQIQEACTSSKPIPLACLEDNKFYDGITELIEMIQNLDCKYHLLNNDISVSLDFLKDIAAKASTADLSDVR